MVSGNYDLEDRQRSGRPLVFDADEIEALIKNNPGHLTRDITKIFHISYMTVVNHFYAFGYMNRNDALRFNEKDKKKS